MSSYSALVGDGLAYAGPDQGIDFTGAGDVYAPYAGLITRSQPSGSGWPGQGAVINMLILEGPARGKYLYYAEDLAPHVKRGDKVQAGQVIARATGSGQAPGIEIGWAQPSGIPLAPRPAPRPAPQTTQEGLSFDRFIQAVSGVKDHPDSGGTIGDVGGAVVDAVTHPGQSVKTTAEHIPGVKQVESVAGFIGKLTDPSYILRGLQVLGGAGLVAVGAVLLAKQVALAPDLPSPLKAAGGLVPAPAVE